MWIHFQVTSNKYLLNKNSIMEIQTKEFLLIFSNFKEPKRKVKLNLCQTIQFFKIFLPEEKRIISEIFILRNDSFLFLVHHINQFDCCYLNFHKYDVLGQLKFENCRQLKLIVLNRLFSNL